MASKPAAPIPPNMLATNPLATVDIRWQRAIKILHTGNQPLTFKVQDVHGVTEAWEIATRHMELRHIDDDAPRPTISKTTLLDVYATLKNAKLMHALLNWFLGSMFDNREMIMNDIQPRLQLWETTRDYLEAQKILSRLMEWKNGWYRETGAFTHHGVDSYWPFKRTFRTLLLGFLPASFSDCLVSIIRSSFKNWEDEESRAAIARDLDSMGILTDFKTLVSATLEEEIHNHVHETCPKIRDRHMLPELRQWFNQTVKTWIGDVFGKGERSEGSSRRFEQHMLKILCDLRILELFDIIVDYTDKTHPLPVLHDLKDCLARTGRRTHLVQELREQTMKRLLQPGAATHDVVQQYVSTIKVLRYLDPPGVLLFGVAEPIRRYLRDRNDTIKIIVKNLIPRRKRKAPTDSVSDDEQDDDEDEEIFLIEENIVPKPIQATEEAYEDYTDPDWLPAANDAEPTFRVQQPSDIISTLVSIFGSKDVFIKELQIAFGQRLLAISDGNYDDEMHNLEVLKVRFGDVALQVCDVMMKDLEDSRRVDQLIDDELALPMHTTVLSRLFWPPMPRTNFKMPGQFEQMQSRYQEEYEKQKSGKKLRYVSNMGTVDVTVELDNGEKCDAVVSPLHAAVIELFSQQRRWSVDELLGRLGNIDATSVSLSLMYWQMAGIIDQDAEGRGFFEIRESLGDREASDHMQEGFEIELGADEGDTSEDREANAEIFWNFVKAMLRNLHPMTTAEVHSRFHSMAPIEQSYDESLDLLEAWQRQGVLDYNGMKWSLPPGT